MSEEYDQEWWKTAKAASLERKRLAREASAGVRPGDAILVVTEGTVTEPTYFNLLREDLKLSTIWIKVIPGLHSDPRHVIRTAIAEVKELTRKANRGLLALDEPTKFDHVWAVIDTDVAIRQGFWPEVVQMAQVSGVKIAGSSPCFEYWLLLHIRLTTRADLVDGDAAKKALRDELGEDYSTRQDVARSALAILLPEWPKAIRHAQTVRRLHAEARTPLPANPSTDVDLLVRTMNEVALPHLRKIIDS